MNTVIYLHEIFPSFQGEGLFVGKYQLFIRLKKCNLSCYYCDSVESREDGVYSVNTGKQGIEGENPVDRKQFFQLLNSFNGVDWMFDTISLTGGEPLLQNHVIKWIRDYYSLNQKKILLETNGTLKDELQEVISDIDIVSMDIKLTLDELKSPEKLQTFLDYTLEFIEIAMRKRLYIKIPITKRISPEIFTAAVSFIGFRYPKLNVFLQDVFDDGMTMKDIMDFYSIAVCHFDNVRYVPQVHKLAGFI
ncbi:7-carboxy-7-deazaguanine synthase QueE [bacterium]|nr:7-carboxy-7-deazaguanine synthase QueE [bacterium]